MSTQRLNTIRQRYVSIPEAATYLGVGTRTIRKMIASGDLRAYRRGARLVRIDRTDLDTVLQPISDDTLSGGRDAS